MPGLPPAAPDFGERSGIAEDLADLGLALRDAKEGQFHIEFGGGAIAARAAGQRVQAGAPQDRGGRELGGQGCPARGLRRGAGELVLDFLVGDRRAEHADQDGLGDGGDSLPGAGGALQVPPRRAEAGRDEEPGAGGGGDPPGAAGHPMAGEGRQVHGQREGLAELACVAAGFRDAHPFPMPGQVCVAVDRAQGLAVLGQEERFQQKGQHRRGHVVGILIRLGEMTDARQLSRAEARQVPLTEGTTRISGRYSSSPLRRKASRVTDPPMVQSPLCLITSR